MNSRERVLTALEFREPDRIPVDLGGHRSSGISAIALHRLRKTLGLKEKPVRVYDMVQQLGILKKGSLYFEQTRFPLMERGIEHDDFHDLPEMLGKNIWSAVPHPGAHLPLDEAGLREMSEKAAALRASTDRAIIGLFGGNMFELPQWLYRMDNYLLATAMHMEKVLQLSELMYEIHLQNLEKWMSAVGPHIDIVLFGDDLGGQQGPLISPDAYSKTTALACSGG